MFVFILSEN